ncbi:ABC transporter substrate-binding protein [Micromonospora sp. NPDC000089]|uniref:ABC transporter substrate-binding protein n=1 Tax=unclassified Micromonospora TaxID=2617518 RepID=UPI00367C5DE1
MALLATGCSSGGKSTDGKDATLVAFTGASTDYQINFNPYAPSSIGGVGTIYEPLFFVTPVTKEVVPRLGTEYKWNDTGTVLSLTTRDGATWSDGQPFSAKDVAFTFDMLKKNQSLNAYGFDGTVAVVDDTHLTMTFPEPTFVDTPNILGKTFIVPEHLWKGVDPTTSVMEKPVGTGPYLLDSFKPQAYTLKANPKYYGGEPKVKAIRTVALSGNQAGANGLANGTIDWFTGPVPDVQNFEKSHPGYQLITVPLSQTVLMTCSNAALGCAGPQTEVAVRKAIYYAMDRKQINKLAFQDTSSDISPGFALPERDKAVLSAKLTEPLAPTTAQPEKATALLEGAGWVKGADGSYAKGGKPLTLSINVVSGWTDYITAVDTLGAQLKAAGIKTTVVQTSWNEWTENRANGKFQLLIDSLGSGPAPDPYYLYTNHFLTANTKPVGKGASQNYARFSDPKVDAALGRLRRLAPTDAAARQPQFDVIQQAVEENMPYIPVLTGGTIIEYNTKKFSGWPTADQPYAFAASWATPDSSQVLLSLTPAGS